MSKAVLVMDMPESCGNCMLEQVAQDSELFQDGETYCCVTIKSVSEHSVGRTKPVWCPLWELPEKRPCTGADASEEISSAEYESKVLEVVNNTALDYHFCEDCCGKMEDTTMSFQHFTEMR